MKVDIVSSEAHFLDHMRPIFDALPAEMRGEIFTLAEPGIPPGLRRNHAVLVGGWQDVQPLRGIVPMIYIEHGAGQQYGGDGRNGLLPGYSGSGGRRHQGVIGFIAPSQEVADRWLTAPAAAVGCPKMVRYMNLHGPRYRSRPIQAPVACLQFHWPCALGPEMGSAWEHYRPSLPTLAERWRLQGMIPAAHVHPRWRGRLDEDLSAAGFALLARDVDVFELADVLVLDNSSIGPEFMSLDRPVVWLNCPEYRRDVHHGGRFWNWTEGLRMVDGPEELHTLNLWDVLADDPAPRRRIIEQVYAYNDGSQAERAAAFVAELVGGK